MRIGEVCIRDVVIVRRDETVAAAAGVMREHGVGDVVVVENTRGFNEPVGIVTDRDIVLRCVAVDKDARSTTAFEIMTIAPVVADEGESVFSVIDRMREHGTRRVPVVAHSGALVGIVAYDDLIELLAGTLARLATVVGRAAQREHEAGRTG